MRQFSCVLGGLARSWYGGKGRLPAPEGGGREVADALAKEARRNEMMLRSPGTVGGLGSERFVSMFSQRGEKGINQDCFIVWEEFGCQEDMIFCGVFDGHGPWGHFVSKKVRESLPPSLLCNWQEALASVVPEKKLCQFDIWKQSYIKTCAMIDKELAQNHRMDSFNSGTTALTIVKQGELMVIANVGDSRAVLATISNKGELVPVQLTVDFKPNLPRIYSKSHLFDTINNHGYVCFLIPNGIQCISEEVERITRCKGRVFCLQDEPGVHRLWLPNNETPGLAMSRAFGDYCIKDFGLISVPEVTQWTITDQDQFIVLATDGVWDVISNQEAVQIIATTKDKGKAAKRLVECAVRAWKRKRRSIAVDDCSAICLFFHSSSPSSVW